MEKNLKSVDEKIIKLTKEESSSLVIMLNCKLREDLVEEYATTLNNIFYKLTGQNHDFYEKRFK